jgi:protein-disulfide isomerase
MHLKTLLLAGAALFAAFGPSQAETPAEMAQKLLAAAPSLGEQSLGKADAPVVLVEYASATCPHCAAFHEKVLPQLKADYIETGKVRFIFREYPLDNLAMGAFMLARCVAHDKYFPTIDMMFRRQQTWRTSGNPAAELFRITQLSGMDKAGFEACLKRQDVIKDIAETARKAREDFGVKGTPAIFINGKLVDGHKEFADLKILIDAALAQP